QLQLVPAWAFTDYKVQGSIMDNMIVDLASAKGIQNSYVMLSRVKQLSNLAILHWFPSPKIINCLPQDLRNEFARLRTLDNQTKSTFKATHFDHPF
ncbi:hypothetical protein EV363DRAFT_1162147, partial [Boletus edulis]